MKTLAAAASTARDAADAGAELTAWREALDLLPPNAAQSARIQARVEHLSAGLLDGSSSANALAGASTDDAASAFASASSNPSSAKTRWTSVAGLTGTALILLTKGKLLLTGLTNATTLFSMLPAILLYWTVYGWRFALGMVLSIYVHEMGHVAALRRFGIAASAPMFIPGLGAVIRSRQQPTNRRELARVGLAGPIWGLGAAVVAFIMYGLTNAPIWGAIGQFGAWVNLFNLTPVWQLDGAHAFSAMKRVERWLATAAAAIMFVLTHEGLLVLIAVFAGMQALAAGATRPSAERTGASTLIAGATEPAIVAVQPAGDSVATAQFIALVVILSWMSRFIAPGAHV